MVSLRWVAVAAVVARCAALRFASPAAPARSSVRLFSNLKRPARARNDRPKGAGRLRQGKKRSELLRGLIDAPAPAAGPAADTAEDHPLRPFVEALAGAADAKKASDVRAYHVASVTSLCSFVVVANGRSRPQTDAIAAAVAADAREAFGREPDHVEGGADGGWTCLDYGDVIVNVMSPASRDFYDIDALWAKAPRVDLGGVLSPETGHLDDDDLLAPYGDDLWEVPAAEDPDLPTW